MSDSKSVSLPPHLWEALELMSSEMGVSSDALMAQAVFTLARLNGFVVPGKVSGGASAAAPAAPAPRAAPAPARAPAPAPKGRAAPAPQPEPEPDPEPDDSGNPFEDGGNEDDGYDAPAASGAEEPYEEPDPEPPPARGGKASLVLVVAGRDPYKMTGDVFTIGRGKSCEFVIDSNRVSREHVRITREGPDFVLEDLNSSNGTFFGATKEKISKRKIKDGDEFTLGNEKVKFQIRR